MKLWKNKVYKHSLIIAVFFIGFLFIYKLPSLAALSIDELRRNADINRDGVINIYDLNILFRFFSQTTDPVITPTPQPNGTSCRNHLDCSPPSCTVNPGTNIYECNYAKTCVDDKCQNTDEKTLCVQKGGTWKLIDNSCADNCQDTANLNQCGQGHNFARWGCSCEGNSCWAGDKCTIPTTFTFCTKDAECPENMKCQAILSQGTSCSSGGVCPPPVILKGECRLKTGEICEIKDPYSLFGNCYGDICSNAYAGGVGPKKCMKMDGPSCSGPHDTSCPTGYRCELNCGPPVVRVSPPDPHPGYACLHNEIQYRNCPICLSQGTRIDTPSGSIPVEQITAGMQVWSYDKNGKKFAAKVIKTGKTKTPQNHQVIRAVFSDGRVLVASPSHPLTNGKPLSTLTEGVHYDGAVVLSIRYEPYDKDYTYDILPAGETGRYSAQGVSLQSTLK